MVCTDGRSHVRKFSVVNKTSFATTFSMPISFTAFDAYALMFEQARQDHSHWDAFPQSPSHPKTTTPFLCACFSKINLINLINVQSRFSQGSVDGVVINGQLYFCDCFFLKPTTQCLRLSFRAPRVLFAGHTDACPSNLWRTKTEKLATLSMKEEKVDGWFHWM